MVIEWIFIGIVYTFVVSDAETQTTMNSIEPYYYMNDTKAQCDSMAASFYSSEASMFSPDDDSWNAVATCIEMPLNLETPNDSAGAAQ